MSALKLYDYIRVVEQHGSKENPIRYHEVAAILSVETNQKVDLGEARQNLELAKKFNLIHNDWGFTYYPLTETEKQIMCDYTEYLRDIAKG